MGGGLGDRCSPAGLLSWSPLVTGSTVPGAVETTVFQGWVGKGRSVVSEVSLRRVKMGVSLRSACDHETKKGGTWKHTEFCLALGRLGA